MNSGSGTSPKTSATRTEKKSVAWRIFFLWIIKIALLVAVTYVGYKNCTPYVMAILGEGAGDEWWRSIPFLGGFLGGVSYLFAVVVGVFIWALFQSLQLFPVIMYANKTALRLMIETEKRTDDQLQISSSDSESLVWLKATYNNLSYREKANGKFLSKVAYAADLVFILYYYTPWGPSGIDWVNLIMVAILMFSFEAAWAAFQIVNRYHQLLIDGACIKYKGG